MNISTEAIKLECDFSITIPQKNNEKTLEIITKIKHLSIIW